jgi:hypothetical protein
MYVIYIDMYGVLYMCIYINILLSEVLLSNEENLLNTAKWIHFTEKRNKAWLVFSANFFKLLTIWKTGS